MRGFLAVSRIGKNPILVPEEVKIEFDGSLIKISGA